VCGLPAYGDPPDGHREANKGSRRGQKRASIVISMNIQVNGMCKKVEKNPWMVVGAERTAVARKGKHMYMGTI
jgi:hypothetical protein